MATKLHSKGDFVYLPSDTLLFKLIANDSVDRCVKVNSPTYLMFLEKNELNNEYCNVFYEGKVWSVNLKDIYEAPEK